MKYFAIIMFVALPAAVWSQATGTIKGTVKTSDDTPAEFVNVAVEGVPRGAVAGRGGAYVIANIAPGRYVVVASFIGLESKRQTVDVAAGEVAVVNFVLTENAEQLQEIVVSAGRLAAESIYVARMPLKNLENPQVYNAVSADLMKQQAITNYDDAMRNVPGVYKLWEATGRGYGDGASYYSLRGFEAQATMVNGLPGLTNGTLDPANIERIEVIKGPSGTLFGSTLVSYGGIINTVTKKPYAGFGGEIGYLAGSFGLNRVTADVNVPLKGESVVLRVNTAYQSENSFQDAGFRKLLFASPSLSFKASERLSFLINTEFMLEERTNPAMVFLGRDSPLQFANLDELNYDPELSFTSNNLSIKNPRFNLQAQMAYKLSATWTSQTVLSRGTSKSDGYYMYVYDNENGLGEFGLWGSLQNGQTITTDVQQNFIGDFTIGTLRNRLVAGLDYFHRNIVDNSSGFAWIYNVTPQGEVNFVNPYTGVTVPNRYLTRASIDGVLASARLADSNSVDEAYSAYFSDVINVTPALLVMASLRVDHFDTEGDINSKEDDFDQTALSPKFGVVYQPIVDKLSVFANYMNGFRNIGPQQTYNEAGDPTGIATFEPEHANQLEFGIKASLFSDVVHATVSYYDIDVANVVINVPGTFNTAQGGQVESKGFEIDVNATPAEGLSLLVGYSYNDSKVVKGDVGNVFLEEGKRPIDGGPANLFNTWITYTLPKGGAKGLGFGVGANYASELAIIDGSVPGKFVLPSYTVVNGTVYYSQAGFRVALNVNNVADKQYYSGYSTVNPQKPRNTTISLAYTF